MEQMIPVNLKVVAWMNLCLNFQENIDRGELEPELKAMLSELAPVFTNAIAANSVKKRKDAKGNQHYETNSTGYASITLSVDQARLVRDVLSAVVINDDPEQRWWVPEAFNRADAAVRLHEIDTESRPQ